MKKIYLLLICCCLGISGFAQIPVAYWSIENAAHTGAVYTVTDDVSTGAGGTITATGIGAIATAAGAGNSALHGGAAAGLALFANGNMSAVAADPTTAATTYWQFNLTTTGLSTLTLTFDEMASAANPKYGVLYSTNGTTWTFVASITTLNGNTMPLTAATWGTASVALPAACNNQAALYIRLYGYDRTAPGNTFSVDNITVLAATTNAGAVFSTANEADIYTMVRSGGAAGQFSRNNFAITGAATNVTINNTTATSGISVAAANTLSITTNATVTFGNTGLVNGAGTFSLAAGGTLVTANTGGIATAGATGSVQSTTRTYNAGANYTYDGAAAQVTGTGLPATLASPAVVTADNSGGGTGVTLSQTTTFPSGTSLDLQKGVFTNTAANLVMSSGANVNRDNGTLAILPTTYSGINLSYITIVAPGASVTTGVEFPAPFNGSVTVNKPGFTVTLQNAKTLPVLVGFGNITLTGGTLASANFNISLSGTWANNDAAAAFTPGTGTVTMNGTAAQTLGGTSSTTFNNFILNNATGVTLTASENVNGTLTLTAGRMTLGINNITLGTASPAVAGVLSNANMIVATGTGQVRKLMTANGSYLYPVGDATGPNYTPITLNFTAGTYVAGAYTGVNVTNAKHPANANVSNYLNRYWSVATSGITAPTYAVTAATYVLGDVAGIEGNISTGEYTGALPWVKFGITNTVTHALASTGVSNITSAFTGITTAGPTVTSSANTSICAGGSTVLSAVTSGGDPTLTFSWAPAAGLSATTGSPVTATPAGTTTYTLTITDGNGFISTATTTITITPGPTAILGANNVCVNSMITLSDLTTGGFWTSGSPGIASIDPTLGIVTGNAAGNANITFTVSSSGCATSTAITVNPLPAVPAIGGVTNECIGFTATISDATTGGVWASSNAATASVNPSTGIVSGLTAGTVVMSYTVNSAFGCITTITTPDTVNSLPVVSAITGPTDVCVNATIMLSDVTTGGMWASSNTTVATVDPILGTVTGVSAAGVNITYTVTNSNGCITAVTTPETVDPLPVIAAITGPTNECAGQTMQLTDATPTGVWSSGSIAVATVAGSTGVVTGVSLGSDNISYTATNVFGCSNSATYAITIGLAMPASALLPADTSLTLCHGMPENLVVNTTGTGLEYQWYLNGSPISGATNNSYRDSTIPGHFVVVLNNGTCTLALPFIDIIQPPHPVIGYNPTGPNLFTGSYTTYQWFLNGIAITALSSGAASAVLPVSLDGNYTVVVSDYNGCFDTSASFTYPIPDTASGVGNVSTATNINVFPNPGSQLIHIDAPVIVNVSVMSIDGKMVLEQKHATDINIGNLANGLYIIKVYDENNLLLKNQKFSKIE